MMHSVLTVRLMACARVLPFARVSLTPGLNLDGLYMQVQPDQFDHEQKSSGIHGVSLQESWTLSTAHHFNHSQPPTFMTQKHISSVFPKIKNHNQSFTLNVYSLHSCRRRRTLYCSLSLSGCPFRPLKPTSDRETLSFLPEQSRTWWCGEGHKRWGCQRSRALACFSHVCVENCLPACLPSLPAFPAWLTDCQTG